MAEARRLRRFWLRPVAAALAVLGLCASLVAGFQHYSRLQQIRELAERIDGHLDRSWLDRGLVPAEPIDDAGFARRAFLDLTGALPPTGDLKAFLADPHPAKRERLVDDLIASRAFARHLADRWDNVLYRSGGVNAQIDMRPLAIWLEEQFHANVPWNQTAYELLIAEGRQHQDGRVTPYLVARNPEEITGLMSRAVLGVRMDCAQCHDHPYASFTHEDFWGMAAFFETIELDTEHLGTPNNMFLRARMDIGADIGVFEAAQPPEREKPDHSLAVPPALVGGTVVPVREGEPRRPMLAAWMTDPDNPFFARAMVNRLWAQFFGRGLVNPVDDLHDGNPATHPELLDDLAEAFVASDFDVKLLVRAIVRTQAYHRDSRRLSSDGDVLDAYAAMPVRVMSPEQLFDSLASVIGVRRMYLSRDAVATDYDVWLHGHIRRNQFTLVFETETDFDPTVFQQGIPQLLTLMNDPQFGRLLSEFGGAFLQETRGASDEQRIERAFLRTFGRRPREAEREAVARYLAEHPSGPGGPKAWAGVFWAMVNATEFVMIR